jgi:hypothetical protein
MGYSLRQIHALVMNEARSTIVLCVDGDEADVRPRFSSFACRHGMALGGKDRHLTV